MSVPPPLPPFVLRPPLNNGRPQPSLFGQPAHHQQPPPSLSSLIFFLLLLTLMNSGPAVQPTEGGEGGLAWVPSSELFQLNNSDPRARKGRVKEGASELTLRPWCVLVDEGAKLDRRIGELEGWKGWVNGTGIDKGGNYSWEVPSPSPHRLLSSLLPPPPTNPPNPPNLYPRNITGFLRHSSSHTFNLSDPASNRTSTSFLTSHLLNHVDLKKDPIFNAEPMPPPRLNETTISSSTESQSNSTQNLPIRRATNTNTTDVDVLWRDELSSTSMRSGGFPWLPPLLPDGSLVEGYEVEKGMEVAFTVKEGWWGKRNNERLDQQEVGGEREREWGAVKGTMDFTSDWSGQTQSYTIQGFHEFQTGTIYLLGSSNSSIIDLRLLPSFFPRHSLAWNSTTRFVTRALEERIDVLREEFERGTLTGSGEGEESISTYTTCPLQIVLRLAPLPHHITPEDVSLAESELFYPTGLPVKTWEVKLEQAAWWSWECGLAGVLEGGEGIRSNTFWKMSTDYSFLSLLASFTTVLLLVRQMERTRTPSQLSKVALPTIAMQIVLDGWSFAAHLLVGIVIDNESSLALIAPGFVSGMGFAMFGPRFCMAISRSQAHEHAPRPTVRPAPPPTTVAVVPPPPATLPLPASAPTEPSPQLMPGALPSPPIPAVPVIAAPAVVPVTGAAAAAVPRAPPMPPSFFENAGPQPIVALIVLFLFLLQTDVLPFVLPFVIFLFYLFWIPQIVRNAERGTKGAFSWWYILGTTAGRCWPLGYFWGGWGGGENVMFLERSNWLPAILISQTLQLLFLAGQDFISPTFFLPARFAPPPPYNYHLLLPRKGDVEGGKGGWEMGDCSICMEPIVRDELGEAGGEGLGGLGGGGGGRKSWAVAPCQHAFHSACLEPWLAIKTACPECRAPLPPM